MTLDDTIARFASLDPNANHGGELCAAAGGSLPLALNAVAIRVAQLYLQGRLEFGGADSIANSLFGYVTTMSELRELPEPMYGIFLAFDEGEHIRKCDPSGTNPAEKYTMPMLREILAKHVAA